MIDEELAQKLYPKKSERFFSRLEEMPVYVRPIVTQSDVENKYLIRYFAKPVNDKSFIVEIDNSQYQKLRTNSRFVVTQVPWKIVGRQYTTTVSNNIIDYGVQDTNRNVIASIELTFTGIVNYIQDYLEFWVAEK